MRQFFLLCLSLSWGLLSGQGRLDGLWEGELTYGGLASAQSYRFQIWIEEKGGYITGRSYVYLNEDEVIEMEINGRTFRDWSISIYDSQLVSAAGLEVQPPFYRKYQLQYKRGIYETALEGYWQEIKEAMPLDARRAVGRLRLERVKMMKP
ncbi:MAG TPA: hypothetical protein PKC76_15890 [Saprospiraceae bacterium]|nr:hypothetical protein [Saprospiraceae bacterium]HMP25613.1 hypothetical protein [Saprospiraceae bacterium]